MAPERLHWKSMELPYSAEFHCRDPWWLHHRSSSGRPSSPVATPSWVPQRRRNFSWPFRPFLPVFSWAKYESVMDLKSAPPRSTLVLVAMQYRWFTRFNGTPLRAKGPVTKSRPLSNCFKKTTRFPSELAGQQDQDLTRLDVLAQLWGLLLNGWLHLLHSLPWWNNTMERWNWTALASNNLSPLNYCRMFLSSQHCFPSDKGNCVSLPLPNILCSVEAGVSVDQQTAVQSLETLWAHRIIESDILQRKAKQFIHMCMRRCIYIYTCDLLWLYTSACCLKKSMRRTVISLTLCWQVLKESWWTSSEVDNLEIHKIEMSIPIG